MGEHFLNTTNTETWSDITRFPHAKSEWAYLKNRTASPIVGKDRAGEVANHWNIGSRTLVATPDSERFLPPICINVFAEKIYKRILWRKYFVLAWVLCFLIFLLVSFINEGATSRVTRGFILVLLALFYVLIDTFIFVKPRHRLIERALYVDWVREGPKPLFWSYIILMFVIGGLQLYFQTRLGSLDNLVVAYGGYLPRMDLGEWWRPIVTIFLHENVAHWFANLVTGAIALIIVGSLAKRSLMLWFFAIAITTVIVMSYSPPSIRPDAVVGISGGICGIFGWIISACLRKKDSLPQYLWLWTLAFGLINVGASSAIRLDAGTIGHGVGFILGFAIGAFGLGVRHFPNPSNLSNTELRHQCIQQA
jgi:membrane associated rhomboid family serine protease